MSLRDQITNVRFTPVRLREGYDMGEVDQFLDELAAASDRGEPLRPMVDRARFTPVRLREGYDMGDVDAFLEQMASAPAGAPTAAPDAPVSATPAGVIQEQRGLLSRLFGRDR